MKRDQYNEKKRNEKTLKRCHFCHVQIGKDSNNNTASTDQGTWKLSYIISGNVNFKSV